ncbi:MAG TPA: DUF4384 domain-containing protein [Stellaceae bacterium]|nr:DUF4384 domain-containing protein [Stellaceae bacterium]
MQSALVALAMAAGLTGASCSGVGDSDVLSDAQQVIADMKLGPSDLRIIGAVDHADRRYRVGERIMLSADVNKNASVAVLRVRSNGDTTIIFPNSTHSQAAIAAGSPLSVTTTADKPGNLVFEFVASTRADAWLFSRKPAGTAEFAELGATTRSIAKEILGGVRPGPGASNSTASVIVKIRD